MPMRKGVELSEKDAELYDKHMQQAGYYDRLQYVYKIKLNSLYGALSNQYFRYFNAESGESTTGTGRKVLMHQCAETNRILTGEYDPAGSAVVYGDSVAGYTVVETLNGPTPIEKLFATPDYCRQGKEYCRTNEKVLTYNPITKQNEYRNVKYIMRHKTRKTMYRVWIGNTRYIDVTEDHSLIGYANSKSRKPGLIEVKPSEIGSNNVNSLILNSSIPHSNNSQHNISKEMWQLLGLIIGDGHVERQMSSGVGLSLGYKDKNEILNKLINPLITQGWFTSYINMKNGHDIRLCGTKGWKFLSEHLYPTGTKQFPHWLLNERSENIRNVLKGYFSADGFCNRTGTIGLCSINLDFIKFANRLLKLCGIASNFWTENTENSFNGKFSGTYTVRLTVYDGVKFGNDIGFIQDRKNTRIPTEYSKSKKHLGKQNGYALIVPTNVEKIEFNDYVYDIEVDQTHTFYANDLLVHNTDSVYFKTGTDDTKSATVVADRIGELVNDTFPEFMKRTFLCQPEYDQFIKTGREVVADRGIFVQKKRYILHVVDNEGETVDKLKTMGLELKKTTLPKPVQNKLSSFVERLLKGDDWNTIANDIICYSKELSETSDIRSFGLPKGVKKVEHYTQLFKEQGVKARLPGHISGAIFYNMMVDHFNDTESLRIMSGMKIKVYILTTKFHNKFNKICLPTDIEQIPDWFIEHFVPLIDRQAHIERLIEGPLDNIIKAIGKQTPTPQRMLVEDVLVF